MNEKWADPTPVLPLATREELSFYIENDFIDETIAYYKELQVRYPRCYEIHRDFGFFAMNRANHAESIRAFKLAAKYYDKDEIHSLAIIYFYLGYSHFELQENLLSIDYFFKAIELDKTRPDLYGFLADALDRLERYEESLENIDIAISLSQNTSSVLYNNKAVTLNCMGRHTEALETLNRGLQTTDQNNINISYIYCNTGMSHVALGNLEEAKKCYEKSLELYPNNPKTSIKIKEYHEIIKKMPQEPNVCDTKI